MDVAVKFLNFKISYTYFTVQLSIDECFTHNKGQYGGCRIKMTQILSILQGFAM